MSNRKLYVGNLPYETGEAQLQELFGQIGAVDSVQVMRDAATGRARGFAFVEMASAEDAAKAVTQFDGQIFKGRTLAVSEARAREDRPGGPRPGGGFAPRPGGFAPRPAGGG
ncbi:MAG: RNA-binding protein, partial [Acidobacteria bacterium]|nr:RNA-binding protein [Acidobacteriota bacterium]